MAEVEHLAGRATTTAQLKSKSTSRARDMWRSVLMSVVTLRTEMKNDRNMENESPTIKKPFQTKAHSYPDTLSTCKPICVAGKSLRSQVQRPPRS